MKNEKKIGQLKRSARIILIPVATFLFVVASFGKPINSGKTGEKSVASQPSAATTIRDTVYVYADEMPLFPNGDSALLNFIAKNTVYPDAAKKNHITGKVIVKFIVEKDCSVSDVTILQSVEPSLDAEAVRVIKTLPKFEKPAKSKGKPVAVWYMVPISYALK